jgi:hypothetical protein
VKGLTLANRRRFRSGQLVARTRAAQNPHMAQRAIDIPDRVGPVEFGRVGAWVAVKCPREHDALMRKAGGLWEPSTKRWLIERRRIGPVIRALERATDPLFRRAGLVLD